MTMAAGGLMYLCGDPDRAPLRVSVPQASAQASIQAVVGTLIALRARKNGAPSQHVDVSMQEAVTTTTEHVNTTYNYTGENAIRCGFRHGGQRLKVDSVLWPVFSRSQQLERDQVAQSGHLNGLVWKQFENLRVVNDLGFQTRTREQ